MTRHTPPTRGDAFVMGHSIRSDFSNASQSMGVVTQENSIYGELTARDHLVLFCRLQGVTEHRIPTLVQESLLIMELGPHAYKPAKRLSGGMKRKLCTVRSNDKSRLACVVGGMHFFASVVTLAQINAYSLLKFLLVFLFLLLARRMA